ncbi:MAG: hypothetical protein WAN43_16340 [Rhodomicrobium sp.]
MPAQPAEISDRLRHLAGRVDRLRPDRHDPVKYFEDRDEIRRDLETMANELSPQTAIQRTNPRAAFSARDVFARGRVVKVVTRGRGARSAARG